SRATSESVRWGTAAAPGALRRRGDPSGTARHRPALSIERELGDAQGRVRVVCVQSVIDVVGAARRHENGVVTGRRPRGIALHDERAPAVHHVGARLVYIRTNGALGATDADVVVVWIAAAGSERDE